MRAFPMLLFVGACSFSGRASSGDEMMPIDGDGLPVDGGSDARIDAPSIDAPPAPWLTGYSARRRIDVLAPGGETLANFGLLVRLDDAAELIDVARESIKFTLADGTTLTPWEAERFDAVEGDLAAWVRVPELRAGETVYLYYGAANPPAEPATPTWDPGRYALVMHFIENGSGPWQSATPDSDTMVVAPGASPPAGLFSPMGVGRRFDANDRIELGSSGSGRLQFGTASFSFSVLMKTPQNLGDWDMPFYKGGNSAGQAGYDMELGAGPWRTCISDGDGDGADSIRCADFVAESTPLLEEWHWLTTVVDREAQQLKAYRDGALQQVIDIASIGSIGSSTRLAISHASYRFNGDVDDLRVYSGVLSDTWIATEWANVFAADSVLRIGAPEAP